MSKKIFEVTDGAGVPRKVSSVDAKEIEAMGKGELVAEEVAAPETEEVTGAFPKDYPGQSAFEKAKIGYHQTLRMTKEELLEIPGIGPKAVDEIFKLRG